MSIRCWRFGPIGFTLLAIPGCDAPTPLGSCAVIRAVRPDEYPAPLKVIGDAFGLVVRVPTVHTVVGESADGHFLAAERDGAIVGTGASIGFGPTGWIGGIAVTPAARGARLGQALTEAVIDAL